MEIFKLFESTIANCEPGHPSNKDLRRSQLLDNYEEAIDTLKLLIKAKETEVSYRRDLVDMLDKSKLFYDNKLTQARQSYINAKKQAPESLDIKSLSSTNVIIKKSSSDVISTTPPHPPPLQQQQPSSLQQQQSTTQLVGAPVGITITGTTTSTTPLTGTPSTPQTMISTPNNFSSGSNASGRGPLMSSSSSSQKSSTGGFNDSLDIPLPSSESQESRSSLDRRLSEFLKTFPNLTQAGLAPPVTNNNSVKPLPGYYTQQPPPPPPPPIVAATPPIMAMMRFPPPTLIPPPPQTGPLNVPPPPHNLNSASQQENHDAADMDLSDYDESSNNVVNSGSSQTGGIIPMVASAMQQGAGGKQHLRATVDAQHSPYATGYNNSAPFAPRLNPLPFDPSIMDSRLRDTSSSSGSSRDKHNDRSHRHSGGSGSSGSSIGKHGSDKNKYNNSSSHSSGRSKRR